MKWPKNYERALLLQDLISPDRVLQDRALEFILKEFRAWVFNEVRRDGGTTDQAKDVMQETTIRVHEHVVQGKFKGESSLRTYFNSVAKFVWRELKRKDGKTQTGLDQLPEFADEGKEQFGMEDEEVVAKVKQLLDKIGSRCKTILLFVYWENRKMEEIAKLMDFKNADVAKNEKSKCMNKLRKMFE